MIKNPKNSQAQHTFRNLIVKLPEYRKAHLLDVVPYLVNLTIGSSLESFFEELNPVIPDEQKETVFSLLIRSVSAEVSPRYGHGPISQLQSLRTYSKKYLSVESQTRVLDLLKVKVETLITDRVNKDPVEAFLDQEISWHEMQFAKVDPEGYKKGQLQKDMQEGQYPQVMVGGPPWFYRRGW